ncbi:hypothetical protein [Streptomyces mirabilis]|uniref:hypothetical protein n=1 Tax=Streptomyces mirabilis TaxID=68239 RepID=UPI00380AD26A
MVKTPERIWEEADLAARRLAGLALNPSTPQDVLLRLLAEGPAAVRMVLCRDRVLPDAVVDAVIEADEPLRIVDQPSPLGRIDVGIAGEEAAGVRVGVAHLADGPRMPFQVRPEPLRLAVSVHPALSEEERAAIDYEVPTDCGLHHHPAPSVPRDPEDVRWDALSAHPMLRRKAAQVHELAPDLVARLADDEDLGVRVTLAQNHPDASAAVLLRSFLEYTGSGRAHFATRPNFPTARLAAFADHEDPEARALAVRDPETAPAVVERLTRDPDPAVRAAAARHPNLPRPRLTELLDDEELARPAAANPALDVAEIRRLARTPGDPAGPSVDTLI